MTREPNDNRYYEDATITVKLMYDKSIGVLNDVQLYELLERAIRLQFPIRVYVDAQRISEPMAIDRMLQRKWDPYPVLGYRDVVSDERRRRWEDPEGGLGL